MHEVVNRSMGEEKVKELSGLPKALVTLGCGSVAGVAAAVLSHPADTLLSQINKGKGEGSATSRLIQLARAAGPIGLFAGLGPRMCVALALPLLS
jgi:solute carrier family 25 phosphate transporter 3